MKKIIILTLTILALVAVLTLTASAETLQPGDMNGDGFVNSDDAIYLLRHTLNPEEYPLAKTPMSETGCINHEVKTIVTNANCITVGKIEYYCDNCDYYEFEYTQTSEGKYFGDHKYEYAGYSILETGCYIQNSDRYECVFCGDEKYEFVSETYNHDYETLTETNGCEVRVYDKCINCGDIINDTTTENHKFGETTTISEVHDCIYYSGTVRICTECGVEDSKKLNKTKHEAHKFIDVILVDEVITLVCENGCTIIPEYDHERYRCSYYYYLYDNYVGDHSLNTGCIYFDSDNEEAEYIFDLGYEYRNTNSYHSDEYTYSDFSALTDGELGYRPIILYLTKDFITEILRVHNNGVSIQGNIINSDENDMFIIVDLAGKPDNVFEYDVIQ